MKPKILISICDDGTKNYVTAFFDPDEIDIEVINENSAKEVDLKVEEFFGEEEENIIEMTLLN